MVHEIDHVLVTFKARVGHTLDVGGHVVANLAGR